MTLSPVFHPASGQWMLGQIVDHVAKPLTQEEVGAHIKEFERMEKMLPEKDTVVCIYCGAKFPRTAEAGGDVADHIMSCEKSPMVQMVKEMRAHCEEADRLVLELIARVEQLETILMSEREALVRFLIPYRSTLPESWMDHFAESCGVQYSAIGFVSAKPLPIAPVVSSLVAPESSAPSSATPPTA